MALTVCLACSTCYAVGLARCPHCGSPDQVEQGSREHEMAKQRVHGGATHESDIPATAPDQGPPEPVAAPSEEETEPDTTDPAPPRRTRRR